MKQAIFVCILCLLILFACDNPMSVGLPLFDEVIGNILFSSALYKVSDTDYSPGYISGLIRSDRIQLKWNKCTDPNFLLYRLYRGSEAIKAFADADSISLWDMNLASDTAYEYRIVAFIKNGRSKEDEITLHTPRFEMPDNLAFSFQNATSLKLTWHNNADSATRYTVEKTSPGGSVQEFPPVNVPYLVDTNVVDGQTYYYRVKAENQFEETEYSDSYTVHFNYNMNAPQLWSLIQQQPTKDVLLSWADNSTGETAFHIYRSVGNQGNYTRIGQVEGNVESYLDSSYKVLGETYFYYVRAFNDQEYTDSNVMFIVITEQTYVSYDFESSNGGFTSTSWEWGYPSWTGGGHSSYNAWGTNLDSYYPDNAYITLTSPQLQIPADGILQFYHALYCEYYYDGGNVQISTNGGASWTIIHPVGGYTLSEIQGLNYLPGFSGFQGYWAQTQFDLSAYQGQTVMFRWAFGSDGSGNSYGWLIDDVMVGNVSNMKHVALEETWQK